MDIPPEVVAAKEALEEQLMQAGLITGIGFGLRDEDAADPDDLALRIFVANAESVPEEVQTVIDTFPFPVVVIQRVFEFTAHLPDSSRYRPIMGGTSVATSRLPGRAETLGAIVQDASDPSIYYGLSNFHVLCGDPNRAKGDPIGTLDHWSFPENTLSGPVDAAVCRLGRDSVPEIVDIGPVFGAISVEPGTQVTKRGAQHWSDGWHRHRHETQRRPRLPAFPAVGRRRPHAGSLQTRSRCGPTSHRRSSSANRATPARWWWDRKTGAVGLTSARARRPLATR